MPNPSELIIQINTSMDSSLFFTGAAYNEDGVKVGKTKKVLKFQNL